jgi:hypothetical protein
MVGKKIVRFIDNEDEATHFGILNEDETITCLCCGGTVEKGEYTITEDFGYSFCYLHEIMEEYF